jgi:flagella basal body P-ring formation protein FlgA
MNKFLILFIFIILSSQELIAGDYSVELHGRADVTVTAKNIRLVDIAEIKLDNDDLETQLALQRLVVDLAPAPGNELTLPAARILERLRESGVDLKKVGYELPRFVKVKRASRVLKRAEVLEALEEYVAKHSSETQIKRTDFVENIKITPLAKIDKITQIDSNRPGMRRFNLKLKDEQDFTLDLKVNAFVDEWREVPVTARALERGDILSEADIAYARLNTKDLEVDIATDVTKLIGLEIKRNLPSGSTLKASLVMTPPVVKAGQDVVIRYKTDYIEASTNGKALQMGAVGDEIKVKNSGSGRIITGKIIESGLIGVNE